MSVDYTAHWRAFEDNKVTHSAAHYLMAIDTLRDEYGYARSTDVASRLEVSRGAASMAIAHLKRHEWVDEDPNKFLLLTPRGHRIAHQVKHNYELLARLFHEVLGVPQDIALSDACKMEHLMSLETGRRLVALLSGMMDGTEAAANSRGARKLAVRKNAAAVKKRARGRRPGAGKKKV